MAPAQDLHQARHQLPPRIARRTCSRPRRTASRDQVWTSSDPELASALASSLRERIPSFPKTLPRWYWTVRRDRNSRAPISGLLSPSRASSAICRSCAVSSSRVFAVPLAHFLAGRRQLDAGPLGERLHPDRRELVVGRAELCARVDATALAAQPLAVEQVRAGEFGAEPGAPETLDRLAVELVRVARGPPRARERVPRRRGSSRCRRRAPSRRACRARRRPPRAGRSAPPPRPVRSAPSSTRCMSGGYAAPSCAAASASS